MHLANYYTHNWLNDRIEHYGKQCVLPRSGLEQGMRVIFNFQSLFVDSVRKKLKVISS